MGGGPDVITTSSQPGEFSIPPELQPLINSAVTSSIGVQGQLPLASFLGPNPQMIPGLTPEQMALLQQQIGFSQQTPTTAPEQVSLNVLNQLSQSLLPSATGQTPLLNPVEMAALMTAGQAGQLGGAEQQGIGLAGQSVGLSQTEQQGIGLAGQSANMTPAELQAMQMAAGTSGLNETELMARNAAQTLSTQGANPFQQNALGYVQQGVPMSQAEQDALQQLGFFTGGQFGQAPATLAAQKAFSQFQAPEIQQALALAGLGSSGAVGASLAEGEARAMVPFLTQEMANRLQASGMTSQIGQTAQGRALQGAGILGDIGGEINRTGLQASTLLAQLGQGMGARELQAAGLIGQTGAGQAGRGLTAANLMTGAGAGEQARGLQAAGLMTGAGGDAQSRLLQAANLAAQTGTAAGQRPTAAAELLTRMTQQASGMGNVLAERARTDTQRALEASGVPREVAAQQAQAQYNEYLRQQALSEAVTLGPLGQYLPSALARGQVGTQTQSG
ncbi:MAG: hypothetical protein Q8R28_15695, partial [Dehalococcoidia bacterium]|nr:hypothetical protein [Dehalococcoidia bacterium]